MKIKEDKSIQEESLDEFLNYYMKKELPEERPRGLLVSEGQNLI
tara:strand:+ start:270 stop:401 length:132 start_codon:yes stop_codon:yes gene_type:complete